MRENRSGSERFGRVEKWGATGENWPGVGGKYWSGEACRVELEK
jgi:hypothetical protein